MADEKKVDTGLPSPAEQKKIDAERAKAKAEFDKAVARKA